MRAALLFAAFAATVLAQTVTAVALQEGDDGAWHLHHHHHDATDDDDGGCGHDAPDLQHLIQRDVARNAFVAQQRHPTGVDRRLGAQQAAVATAAMRFVASTDDLYNSSNYCTAAGQTRPDFKGGTVTCAEANILTPARRAVLLAAIDAAFARLAGALKVVPITGNLAVGNRSCTHYTVPDSHHTVGVPNADFVLYVSAAPTDSGVRAWGGRCQLDPDTRRPVVGRANFNPNILNNNSAADYQAAINTVTHEIMHSLGVTSSVLMNAAFSRTAARRGKIVTEVVTPNVVSTVRGVSGCATLTGAEVEDESTSAGSHWEKRIYKDELMTASGGRQLSVLSLSLLADMGVGYDVVLAAAEPMEWGVGAGCGFHHEKCNTVAGGAGSYFCFDTSGGSHCAPDLKGIGPCGVSERPDALEPAFQYFPENPRLGGQIYMDGCPFVQAYSNRRCNDASYDAGSSLYTFGFTYAQSARCYNSTGFVRQGYVASSTFTFRCLATSCTTDGRVQFTVNDSSTVITCPANGASVSVDGTGYSGNVTCPSSMATMCGSLAAVTNPPLGTLEVIHVPPTADPNATPAPPLDATARPAASANSAARGAGSVVQALASGAAALLLLTAVASASA